MRSILCAALLCSLSVLKTRYPSRLPHLMGTGFSMSTGFTIAVE